MNTYFFTLSISYQTFLSHYSGAASAVIVRSDQGLTLQLPAARLRPFLTQLGVQGRFRLITDSQHKFVRLEKIA